MDINEALKILDLPQSATTAQIREAYRDLAKVWHPDRFGSDPKLRAKAEEQLKVNFRRVVWSFITSVPRQITESSQTNWKGMGVEPDVKVSANEALKTVRLAAVNKVAEKTSDDRRRDQLKELSQTLQKELDHLKIPLQMIQ